MRRLVDGVAYRDEVYGQGESEGRQWREASLSRQISGSRGASASARKKSGADLWRGRRDARQERLRSCARRADDGIGHGSGSDSRGREDDEVKAILFRVDSPGGSYVASDTIWREVVNARKAHKPVIVSMGNLAGSGGYFVAMAADKIVAQPGTITASIGVLGGKMLTSGLWDKVGLSWDEVHDGDKATMFTGTHDYTPAEWARFEAWLDRVYVDFTGKVAEGRKLPKDKVLEIAKGRIWSGQDAKNLGLVDELGGYDVALKLVKKAIGVADSDDVNLVVYPRPKKWYETLVQRITADNSDKEAAGQALARILQDVQPVARELKAAGITRKGRDQDDVLMMPEFEAGK